MRTVLDAKTAPLPLIAASTDHVADVWFAWISRNVIFGGESTNKPKGAVLQFHPATVQWRTHSGEIGWVQLTQSPMVDATADEHGLNIFAAGTIRFRIHAGGMVMLG